MFVYAARAELSLEILGNLQLYGGTRRVMPHVMDGEPSILAAPEDGKAGCAVGPNRATIPSGDERELPAEDDETAKRA